MSTRRRSTATNSAAVGCGCTAMVIWTMVVLGFWALVVLALLHLAGIVH